MNAHHSNYRDIACDRFEKPGRGDRRVGIARTILAAVLIGITVLASTIVMPVIIGEMYAKCGPTCWQGLQQVLRNRY
jgi:hypothetical protein